MSVSVEEKQFGPHFALAALERGETVRVSLSDGRVLEVVQKVAPEETQVTAESRKAMFNSWQGKARLIDGWDSPEMNAEIWEEFWAKLEEEGPFPPERDARGCY